MIARCEFFTLIICWAGIINLKRIFNNCFETGHLGLVNSACDIERLVQYVVDFAE